MDLKEISWGSTDWIVLAQGTDKRWALVNAGMNLSILQNVNFLTSTIFLTSQEGQKDTAAWSYILSYTTSNSSKYYKHQNINNQPTLEWTVICFFTIISKLVFKQFANMSLSIKRCPLAHHDGGADIQSTHS
jgi:hypothetical protein